MARVYNATTVNILERLAKTGSGPTAELKSACGQKLLAKDFYNYLFRLQQQGLIEKNGNIIKITEEGKKILARLAPQADGVWKIIIFDIPEKHKYVRTVLRAKLKQLNFKKWQNSIWVSPYALDAEIEQEFRELGKKFFIRLIKTTDINSTEGLEKMFGIQKS